MTDRTLNLVVQARAAEQEAQRDRLAFDDENELRAGRAETKPLAKPARTLEQERACRSLCKRGYGWILGKP